MAKQLQKNTSRQDWHPADILAALHKQGITLKDLAALHGLSDSSTLSKAMLNSYPISERRLAEAAGVPVQVMFAARYNEDGTPVPRGIRGLRKRQSTASEYQRNGNVSRAA
jgi:Ner family transcriptional regulator